MIRVGVLGSGGRMGGQVLKLLETEFSSRATLAAAVDRDDDVAALADADAVIDFSMPGGALALARVIRGLPPERRPALVIGSTGWKIDEKAPIEALAKESWVLMSSNFSTGVLALLEIVKQASPVLDKLGYTPVLVETHHKHKKDAPSGTAISLQRAIAPAGPGNVQTHSVRAGEIIGDHEITYYGPGDHVTIGHFAQDRSIFARGAIEAALWLAGKRGSGARPSGILGMDLFFKERYL